MKVNEMCGGKRLDFSTRKRMPPEPRTTLTAVRLPQMKQGRNSSGSRSSGKAACVHPLNPRNPRRALVTGWRWLTPEFEKNCLCRSKSRFVLAFSWIPAEKTYETIPSLRVANARKKRGRHQVEPAVETRSWAGWPALLQEQARGGKTDVSSSTRRTKSPSSVPHRLRRKAAWQTPSVQSKERMASKHSLSLAALQEEQCGDQCLRQLLPLRIF